MTTTHQPPEIITVESNSLLGGLRRQAHELATDKTIDIPIAGWHRPELVARYRFLPEAEAKAIGDRIRESDEYSNDRDRSEAGLIASMVEACEGLYAREGNKLEPVAPEDGGGPCRYDDRLEIFLFGESSGSSRAAVLAAFKGNWLASLNHARLLMEWMTDTSKTIEQLLGEA